MAEIRIALIGEGELGGVPVVVEVVGADLERRWRQAVRVGGSATASGLDPGSYSVRVALPSGRTVGTHCVLSGETDVKTVTFDVGVKLRALGLDWTSVSEKALRSDARGDDSQLGSIWLRLWGGGSNGRWTVRPWPTQVPKRSSGQVQYEFQFRSASPQQYFLQVGGPIMQWRLTALPADDIRVLISAVDPRARRDEADSAVEVTVVSMNQAAEALSRYLARGDLDRASLVGEDLLAEDLLDGKPRDATSAAIAGYFLLAINDLERLQELWRRKLVDSSTWLPDTPVIDAWAAMRAQNPDFQRARRGLLEAAARGVPVYTRGLRLLLDGLATFAEDPAFTGVDVKAALERVRRFAANADWQAGTTTFIGADPTTPGRTRGDRPDTSKHLVFLGSADSESLAWLASERIPGQPGDTPMPDFGQLALGEVGEELDPVDPWLDGSSADPQELWGRSESRLVAEETRAAAPNPPDDVEVTPEAKLLARLFRASDLQTEAEELATAVPVPLELDVDNPPQLYGLAVERVIGLTDCLSLSFMENGLQAARAVARLVLHDSRGRIVDFGTGFLASPRLLVTCHHVLPSPTDAALAGVEFDYQDGTDGRLLQRHVFTLDPDAFFVTDTDLDATVVAIAGARPGEAFGWLPLSDADGRAIIGERLSAVQHPDGAPKQVSLRENRVTELSGTFFRYRSDAAKPSSGAPLFNDQWDVVGVHHASMAERDAAGQALAIDFAPWTPEKGLRRLRWSIHEGILARSIARYLRGLELPDAEAELRDELIYAKHLRNPAATLRSEIAAWPVLKVEAPARV